MSMGIGADDTGDDIEIGTANSGDAGTSLSLVPLEDGSLQSTFVLEVGVDGTILTLSPVDGIRASGFGGGSAVVGRLQNGDAPAIVGQGRSANNPGVLGTNDLGTGVTGTSGAKFGMGVFGSADDGIGVFGRSSLRPA
jgi:hypothetical protein